MADFDEREQGYETKFARDTEFRFKAEARAARLIGLWAAGQMGLEGEAAQDYARSLVGADLEEAGSDDVLRQLRADFAAKDIDASSLNLEKKMAECLTEALKQLESA